LMLPSEAQGARCATCSFGCVVLSNQRLKLDIIV
jgi:hypothetical protein